MEINCSSSRRFDKKDQENNPGANFRIIDSFVWRAGKQEICVKVARVDYLQSIQFISNVANLGYCNILGLNFL